MSEERSIAERLFDGNSARAELEDELEDAGAPHDRIGFDEYDCSLEIHGVPPEHRLSDAAQRIVRDAGFVKVYVNHTDKWETHYSWKGPEFVPSKGWRVSYPHRRGEGEKGIWVEEFIPGWPKDWFDSGYAIIKNALGK